MDTDLKAIFLVVATVLFAVAVFAFRAGLGWLVPLGLALWCATEAWDAFEAA